MVPKQLTDEHKQQRIDASQSLVTRYRKEQNEFLSRIITCDGTSLYTRKQGVVNAVEEHVFAKPQETQVATICTQGYGLRVLGHYELFLWTLCLQDIL